MALDHIQIPIPRFSQRVGGIALFLTLAAVIVLSSVELSEQVYLLSWMRQHDRGSEDGFWVRFGHPSIPISWLPTLLYRGPHHQLAAAACIVNIVMSVFVMGLFLVSCRVPKNFKQHHILIATFLPTTTLLTTALLYTFIEHGTTERLNTYQLSGEAHGRDEGKSPIEYFAYRANWLDFESWSCDLSGTTTLDRDSTPVWRTNCERARRGRWLLLPTWFAVVVAAGVSWLAFRGLPAWRVEKEEEEYVVEGGEGRVRLP
ncbi:hypothetical protein GGR53DRAFT_149293 [Hypoxylon sp. FL1150]|nr:hypothetical protein GGR53DRAFT_149293 [Hypoxylon sp. FL1150]